MYVYIRAYISACPKTELTELTDWPWGGGQRHTLHTLADDLRPGTNIQIPNKSRNGFDIAQTSRPCFDDDA